MENNNLLKQQMEALQELYNYNQKLMPAIQSLIEELRQEKKEDTDELLSIIINGINWIIEIMNRTMNLINEKEEFIEKERINEGIQKFASAIREKDDLKIADCLEKDILVFLIDINMRVAAITKLAC